VGRRRWHNHCFKGRRALASKLVRPDAVNFDVAAHRTSAGPSEADERLAPRTAPGRFGGGDAQDDHHAEAPGRSCNGSLPDNSGGAGVRKANETGAPSALVRGAP
jgi:hypothetical protein